MRTSSEFMRGLIFSSFLLFGSQSFSACLDSFDELRSSIELDDTVLNENLDNFHIEEIYLDGDGKIIEKRTLSEVPARYTYEGRVYPSASQQEALGITTYVRRIVRKNVRVVTEKLSSGAEPSTFWFWRLGGCWKLNSRKVKLES